MLLGLVASATASFVKLDFSCVRAFACAAISFPFCVTVLVSVLNASLFALIVTSSVMS